MLNTVIPAGRLRVEKNNNTALVFWLMVHCGYSPLCQFFILFVLYRFSRITYEYYYQYMTIVLAKLMIPIDMFSIVFFF